MKNLISILKKEGGQTLVLAALLMVVIMGFAAFTVDIGLVTVTKSKLQNDADAAALAGVMSISEGKIKAENIALSYAKANDSKLEDSKIQSNPDYNLGIVTVKADVNSRTVEVVCTKKISYTFARILGFKDTEVSVRAVAENPKSEWTGDALPFINLGFDYSTTDPSAWTKVGPGIKGTITDFYTRNSGSDNCYFEIDYADGITVTSGYSNGEKGLDGSKLSDGLAYVITPADMGIKKVYVFSLRADIIKKGEFTVNGGTKISLDKLNKLNNGDVIDPEQLVIIECIFDDCKWSNQHDIKLTYLNKVYDLGNDDPGNPLPDYPTDYVSPDGGGDLKLIE